MRIIEINARDAGSTGRIAYSIGEHIANSADSEFLYITTTEGSLKLHRQKPKKNHYIYGNPITNLTVKCFGRLTGYLECISLGQTNEVISVIKKFKPDVIHLHILHNSYLNLSKFFKFLQKYDVPVVWTFHDCWPFTGRCPYFTLLKCDKWKKACGNCPFGKKEYPPALFNHSWYLQNRKMKMLHNFQNLYVVTPSYWLERLTKESFFRKYPVQTIHNGIDLSLFKRMDNNDFREKYSLKDKFVILGVANAWGTRKGIDVFNRLSKDLDNGFKIVLVGTSQTSDVIMPEDIISISHTSNIQELCEIYSAADLFVNPTYEDNFPTVNLESLACGTPVLTYDTGGSKESLDMTCGKVVPCGDYDQLLNAIYEIEKKRPFSRQNCIEHSKRFDKDECWKEYSKLLCQVASKRK